MSSRSNEEAIGRYLKHLPNAVSPPPVKHGFGKFYKCTKFSDVTLVDDGGTRIAAHRLVLSAGSTRFDELLVQQGKGTTQREVSCTDLEPSCLHLMIEYLYTNNCEIQIHSAVKLLAAAMLYGCHELENMSNLFIHIHLNSATCCFFFAEAQKLGIDHIARKCTFVASLDFNIVIRTLSFCHLATEDLIALLGSEKIRNLPKLLLYKAGCAWIMQDVSRLEKFKDVLFSIQMGCRSSEELKSVLNGTQGAGIQQLSYPEGFALDNSSSTNGLDLSRVPSSQAALLSQKGTDGRFSASANGEGGEFTKVASVKSIGASDVASEMHLDSVDPFSLVITQHLAQNVEKHQQTKDNTKSHNSTSNNTESLLNSDSMESEVIKPVANPSLVSQAPARKTSRAPRVRGNRGKKTQANTCQVEGCTNDLKGLKEYHNRYKICSYHLKVESIIKDGVGQRFCQQCGRFHQLSEFDNKKRSCRARLLRHNERRRSRLTKESKVQTPEGVVPFPGPGSAEQHLVYLSQMNRIKTRAKQRNEVERGLSLNEGAIPVRCLPILPAELEHCFMIPPANPSDPQSTPPLSNNHNLETLGSHNPAPAEAQVSTNQNAEFMQ